MTTDPDTSTWKQTPDGIPIPPPSPDDVRYESADGVARIVLNRPLVLNAINRNLMRLLDAALDRAEADDDVRALILTGAGRAFSAGGDLWSSLYPDDDPAPDSLDVLMRIWSFPKPVVAAVRGHAVGQGCQLAGREVAVEGRKQGLIFGGGGNVALDVVADRLVLACEDCPKSRPVTTSRNPGGRWSPGPSPRPSDAPAAEGRSIVRAAVAGASAATGNPPHHGIRENLRLDARHARRCPVTDRRHRRARHRGGFGAAPPSPAKRGG